MIICMCIHDTDSNDRTKYTGECLSSLFRTVNLFNHRVVLIDNNSCLETKKILNKYRGWNNITLITLSENIGTARGINYGLRMRKAGEVATKMDNDCIVHESGWADKMEKVFKKRPEIGVLGLKRDDVYGELIPNKGLLMNEDIMGTCTAYNPLMLDKCGFLNQISPYYGGDDVLISARSLAAGFKNAFMKDIKITHLDDGKNPYCEWKRREAGVYLNELSIMVSMIRKGELDYYYEDHD